MVRTYKRKTSRGTTSDVLDRAAAEVLSSNPNPNPIST